MNGRNPEVWGDPAWNNFGPAGYWAHLKAGGYCWSCRHSTWVWPPLRHWKMWCGAHGTETSQASFCGSFEREGE